MKEKNGVVLDVCDHPLDRRRGLEADGGGEIASWCARCGALKADAGWEKPSGGGEVGCLEVSPRPNGLEEEEPRADRAIPARLDEDRTAKPLTEIAEVFEPGDGRTRTLFEGAGKEYVVKDLTLLARDPGPAEHIMGLGVGAKPVPAIVAERTERLEAALIRCREEALSDPSEGAGLPWAAIVVQIIDEVVPRDAEDKRQAFDPSEPYAVVCDSRSVKAEPSLRESLAKPDCENCHGSGSWHDIVFDEQRQCPCVTGEAMKAPSAAEPVQDTVPYAQWEAAEDRIDVLAQRVVELEADIARFRKQNAELHGSEVEDAFRMIETWSDAGGDSCGICLSHIRNGEHGQVWAEEIEKNIDCPVGVLRAAFVPRPETTEPEHGERVGDADVVADCLTRIAAYCRAAPDHTTTRHIADLARVAQRALRTETTEPVHGVPYAHACDTCGWRHTDDCPPRDRWRSWEQRAIEAERVIAEMQPRPETVLPREQALRHALVAIGIKAVQDDNETIRGMVTEALFPEPDVKGGGP